MQFEFQYLQPSPKTISDRSNGDYYEGGHKNVDIPFKLLALRIIWIRRLIDDSYHPFMLLHELEELHHFITT